jgi:hypothetical protein
VLGLRQWEGKGGVRGALYGGERCDGGDVCVCVCVCVCLCECHACMSTGNERNRANESSRRATRLIMIDFMSKVG